MTHRLNRPSRRGQFAENQLIHAQQQRARLGVARKYRRRPRLLNSHDGNLELAVRVGLMA
mgnify:FL=1